MNLSDKMRLQKEEEEQDSTIIILDFDKKSYGVAVNSVDCVMTYESSEISLPTELERQTKAGILGVAKKDKSLTLLLDLQEVLNLNHDRHEDSSISIAA